LKKTKALTYLIWAKQNCRCYACYCHHTKPKAPGGLAFVMVHDDDSNLQSILDQQEREDMLLEFSRLHFAKAEGTPFATEPLGRILAYNGLTTYGNKISRGRPHFDHYHFDEPTQAILENLKQKVQPGQEISHALNYDGLMDGIKKWPEQTTTSPSGRHLGIYETLRKHVQE